MTPASLHEGFRSGDDVGIGQWRIFCYSSKQGCHNHQPLQPSTLSPEETQGWKEHLPSSSHQSAATPCFERWGNSGCENTGYWPGELRCISKEWSQRALALASSQRKALNPWTYPVSLISCIFWCSQVLALCCKTSTFPSSSPCRKSLEQFLRAPWNAVSWAEIKLNSCLWH